MIQIAPKCNDSDLLSPNQAAELLGIHRNTLNRYAANKVIKPKIRRESRRKVYEGREIKRFWMATF